MLPLRSSLRPRILSRQLTWTVPTRSISQLESDKQQQEDRKANPIQPQAGPSSSHPQPSELAARLRNWSENTAIAVRTRADEFSSSTRTTLSQLGLHLNRITGYEEIEALKRRVVEQESHINDARNAARAAKAAYDLAVLQRSNSQREINDLLQRKSTWNHADIARFTTLVPQDHVLEQQETTARAAVHDSEEAVEVAFTELMRTILARYHEEQVWSDKIRSASTYGSLAALALNLLVFVTAIIFVEPWKRRRLAMTFEKKIEEMEAEYKGVVEAGMADIARKIEKVVAETRALSNAEEEKTPTPPPTQSPTEGSLPNRVWNKTRDPEVAGTLAGVAAAAGEQLLEQCLKAILIRQNRAT
ncbi:NADPH--cytochrome P450 reductase [Mycena indigotica]|uniref:Sensitive to high expression protein 9, mitochondrial n=1 Tax=Mycena indigotica TaxID=2126181 RepID=A0A8H6SIG3_9AGAR|nr:NADPH--cytochrome P450 reductase [Mycena indigotica]KAF7299355.1 NADPH--cytochrome P450 reductase [Mycena indigotica]